MKTNKQMAQDLIDNCNGVLLGSRAFGVDKDHSDWDVAVLKKYLPEEYSNYPAKDMSSYFNFVPLKNAYLIKLERLDVLVYEDIHDFLVVKQSVKDLKSFPNYFLQDKDMRIKLFEKALEFYGFLYKHKGIPY